MGRYDEQVETIQTELDKVRTYVVNTLDELVPTLQATDATDGDLAHDRLSEAINTIDSVYNRLTELDGFIDDLSQQLETAEVDLMNARDIDASVMATRILNELDGRTMTDNPDAVVAWVRRALLTVTQATTNDEPIGPAKYGTILNLMERVSA